MTSNPPSDAAVPTEPCLVTGLLFCADGTVLEREVHPSQSCFYIPVVEPTDRHLEDGFGSAIGLDVGPIILFERRGESPTGEPVFVEVQRVELAEWDRLHGRGRDPELVDRPPPQPMDPADLLKGWT